MVNIFDFNSKRDERKEDEEFLAEIKNETDDAYAAFVNGCYDKMSNQRAAIESAWYTNIAMVLGLQNQYWNHVTRRFEQPPAVNGRKQLISNKMMGFHEKIVAKLTRSSPRMYVQAGSMSDRDKQNARLAENILEHERRRLGFLMKRDQCINWAAYTGSSFMHMYWDVEAGQKIPGTNMMTGEVALDVLSSFQLYASLTTPTTPKQEQIIKAQIMPISAIGRKWGVHIKEEQISNTSVFFQEQISSIQHQRYAPSSSGDNREKSAVVKELWRRPCREFPNGLVLLVAGNRLLRPPMAIPNKDGKFGIWRFDDITIPGRYFGQSRHEHATQVQRERNKIISQIIESGDATGRGKWAVQKGSGIKRNAMTSLANEIIEYKMGSNPPTFVGPGQPPAGFERRIERCDQDLMEIYTQTLQPDFVPPGVTSGKAIGYVQEENDSVLGPSIRQHETNYEEMFTFDLELQRDNVIEPRDLPILEGHTILDTVTYVGKDIQVTKVKVEAGSAMPMSKIGAKMVIDENYAKGYYGEPGNPQVVKHVQELLEIGRTDRLMTDEDIEEENAEYAADLMRKGEKVKPKEADLNDVWIAVLERYLREKRYTLDDKEYKRVLKHLDERKEMAMETAEASRALDEKEAMNMGGLPSEPTGGLGEEAPMGPPSGDIDAEAVGSAIPNAERLPQHKLQAMFR